MHEELGKSQTVFPLRIHFILAVDFLCIQEGGLIKLSKSPLTTALECTAQ